MDNVRLRRLKSDYEAVRRLVRLHPRIEIEGVAGNPPEKYRLLLRVKSLRERGEEIETAREHRLEILLPRGYPRDAPIFRMLTPVFHPNIAPHVVCIGDHWSASEPLDALIQRVGEMLAYQSYNTKSPLNGRAAQWVEENQHLVPTDREEFFVDLSVEARPSGPVDTARCGNCGARGVELQACAAGHLLCGDCVLHCTSCGRMLCMLCGETETCQACAAAGRSVPPPPVVRPPAPRVGQVACQNCGQPAPPAPACGAGHYLCDACFTTCPVCQRPACLLCGLPCPGCRVATG